MRLSILSLFLLTIAAHAAELSAPPSEAETGGVLDCESFYPADERAKGVDGITLLSVRIATDETLHDVMVAQSSGHDDLDAAAVACAQHIRIVPATLNGKLVDVGWQTDIFWRHGGHTGYLPHIVANDVSGCRSRRIVASRGMPPGITTIPYDIAADGSVGDLQVSQSSGHSEMDSTALTCFAGRRYAPLTGQGPDVHLNWKISVNWGIAN